MTTDAGPLDVARRSRAARAARERAGRGEQRRQGRQVRQAMARRRGRSSGVGGRFARPVARASPSRRRASSTSASTAATSKSTASSSRRAGRGAPRTRPRPARRSVGRGRAGRAAAGVVGQASRRRRCLPRQHAPPAGLRPADAVGVGRAVDLAGRGRAGRVGRAQLERVEPVGRLARAVAGPRLDGVGGRVEQLVEPLDLVGLEPRQDVVAAVADRVADADPEPAELLGPQLVDDRAQAVVAAVAARLAEAELAERQREVVRDDRAGRRAGRARGRGPCGRPGPSRSCRSAA